MHSVHLFRPVYSPTHRPHTVSLVQTVMYYVVSIITVITIFVYISITVSVSVCICTCKLCARFAYLHLLLCRCAYGYVFMYVCMYVCMCYCSSMHQHSGVDYVAVHACCMYAQQSYILNQLPYNP